MKHTLAISESFVSMVELSRRTTVKVRTFLTGAHCWWPDGNGGHLRPDALVLVEDEHYEATTWLEIDQGSEDMGRIRGKLEAYERFSQTGSEAPNGVLPNVLFATRNSEHAAMISREIASQRGLRMVYETTPQHELAAYLFQGLQT